MKERARFVEPGMVPTVQALPRAEHREACRARDRSDHALPEALARSRRSRPADVPARVAVPEAIRGGCRGLEIEGPGWSIRRPGGRARQEALGAIGLEPRMQTPAVPAGHVESNGFGAAMPDRQGVPDHVTPVEAEVSRALRTIRFTIDAGQRVIVNIASVPTLPVPARQRRTR